MSEKRKHLVDYNVPSASMCDIFICSDPGCGQVHIVGLDESGRAFCEIVMSERMINASLDAMHRAEMEKQDSPAP